jgi:hypothetical protein
LVLAHAVVVQGIEEPEPQKTKTSQPFPGISHVHQLFINKKKRLKHIDIRTSTRYLEYVTQSLRLYFAPNKFTIRISELCVYVDIATYTVCGKKLKEIVSQDIYFFEGPKNQISIF